MAVLDKLTHSISITEAETIDFAGNTITGATTTGVDCYIIPKARRFLSDKGIEEQSSSEIILKGTAVIEVGYQVSNGVDIDGVTLVNTSRIINVDKISDPKVGMKVIIAFSKTI